MTWKRRRFVQAASAVVGMSTIVPSKALGTWWQIDRNTESDLNTLVVRAVDVARAAGATYADARLTVTRRQNPPIAEEEIWGFGVRVLVAGCWGFLSSNLLTLDEAVRLAQRAVDQARAHNRGQIRDIELASVAQISNRKNKDEWIMPIKYDPFNISIAEKLDVMNAFVDYAQSYTVGIKAIPGMMFERKHQVFASSDDILYTQTRYLSAADFTVVYREARHAGLVAGGAAVDFLSPAGKGWEHVLESKLFDKIPEIIDFAEQSRYRKPVEVGRYDIVFTAPAMAALLDQTLGAATELDRALGYEANAQGTSYLSDPLQILGKEVVGSPLLNVTANRSFPSGAATVKWDDEGVEPEDFDLITNGVLVDYQTTRESAMWIGPYYQNIGKSIRSNGCASSESGLGITLQHSPNLQLMPGKEDISFEDLVAGTQKGIAIYSLDPSMDQQKLNGAARGVMREISNGKLGKFINGGTLVFRSPELWKSLVALGGPRTVQWTGISRSKGQPVQYTTHSVGAVPAKFKQLSIVDLMRKA